jgi:branched-chain amino acid transport system substrate-binding protein|uniref:ABC transporter substrate-binding protein n=1 Tax=Desulfobacca acetoxidans TaxID=60893 RepID=A0A7C5ESK6_9BACT
MKKFFKLLILASSLVFLLMGWGLAAEPIKLGAFFALSGPAAHIGTPTKLVAEMVVEKINKEGGINGRPLMLIIGDTESDPAKAATIAKKFIHQDKVAAIIGPTSTGEAMNVKKIVEEAGIPIFMTVGGDPPIMKETGPYTYIFKSPQRSSVAVQKLFGYLKDKGLTKVALITATDPFGKDGATWLKKLAPDFGITFVAEESFGPKDTDMTAQLTKIKNANPQAIICWTIGPAGAIVSKNKAQLGIKVPLFQCHGLPDPKYIELAGKAAEGDRMPSTKLMVVSELKDDDPQKPIIQNFIKLYQEKGFDKQFPINTHSGYAWDAIMIVANALKKAGPDPKKLRDAIEATKGYVGISGIYNLTPEDHNGLGVDSMVMVEVKDGRFVLAK